MENMNYKIKPDKIRANKQTTNKLQTFSKMVKSSSLTNSKNIVRMRLEDMLGVER